MIIYDQSSPPTGPKEDLLLQSAHRLVHTLHAIQDFENREAEGRKDKEPELVPFTPQYWRKWQGSKRKDLVASKVLHQARGKAGKKPKPQLGKTPELGPKLDFSSRHQRVVVMPFGTPPRDPLPETDLVKDGSINSPYLSRYQFIAKSRRPSPHSAKKIRSRTEQGVSFGMSTREDYDKPTSLSQGPAMYNISRALEATLPNAGHCVFGTSKGASALSTNNNPGPGYYTDILKPLGTKDLQFSHAPKVSMFGGQASHEPGPQHYKVPAPFGREGPKFSFSSSPYEPPPAKEEEELEPYVAFGHGCDFVQHVKYGRCLDGRCSKRAMWEDTTTALAAQNNPEVARKIEELHKVLSDTKSPLHFSVIRGETNVVSHVLLHGADPDAKDELDRTALHYAASMGDYRSVKRLVENDQHPFITPKGYITSRRKAQVNVLDKEGNSAMHLASRGGHWFIAQLLFKHGARCDTQNLKGETPLDMAKSDDVYSKMKFLLDIDRATEDLRRVSTKLERAKVAIGNANDAAQAGHKGRGGVGGKGGSHPSSSSLGSSQGTMGSTVREGAHPQGRPPPVQQAPVDMPTMAL